MPSGWSRLGSDPHGGLGDFGLIAKLVWDHLMQLGGVLQNRWGYPGSPGTLPSVLTEPITETKEQCSEIPPWTGGILG